MADNTPNFARIALKYKNLDAFAKAARTTFAKGRMTLKSKKDLQEGQRIVLSISIPEQSAPIDVVCEVIQQIQGKEGEAHTFGVRWLNFTEKKLNKLMESVGGVAPAPAPEDVPPPPPPPPPPKPAPPPPPPPPPPKPKAAPAPEPEPPEPTPEPQPEPEPVSPPPEDPAGDETDEFTIHAGESDNYPTFMDKPAVIIPDAPPMPEPPPAQPEPEIEPQPEPEPEPEPEPSPAPEAPDPDIEATNEFGKLPWETGEDEPVSAPPADEGSLDLEEPEPPAPPDLAPEPAPEPEPEPDADTSLDLQAMEPPADESALPPLSEDDSLDLEEPEPAASPDPVPEPEEPAPELAPEPEPEPEPDVDTSLDLQAVREPEPEPTPALADEGSLGLDEPDISESVAPDDEPALQEPAAALDELPPEPELLEPGPEEPAELTLPDETAPDDGAGVEEPMPDRVAGDRPFSSEELAALAVFLQRLLRAILNPAWTEGEQDRLKPLFEEFKALMSSRQEIGIYMRSAGKGREFMLAGDTLGPVNLKAEMPAAQFAELAPRMIELFTAKALVGMQFRRHLTEDNFRAFVAELSRYDGSAQQPAELAAALLRQGIFSASVVHEADRIEKAVELDFRVDITLSRLRGDLLRLGLMAEAIQEDPGALWTLRVEDALKTVKEGKLRAELLLCADLVTAGQDEITETDLVQEVVMASPVETVVEVAEALGSQYESLFTTSSLAPTPELETAKNRVRRLLRQVTARLTVDDPDAAAGLMGGLYRRGVFTLEELPPELRERVMLEQYIDFFLTDPDQRMIDFANIRAGRDYKNAADRYVRMIGELVRRGDLDSADRIFRTLVEHVRLKEPLFPERQQLSRAALSGLTDERQLRTLVFSLETVEKEKRERLAGIVYATGKAAVKPIIDLLAKAEDRSLRRLLCEILTRMGESIAPELLARARNPQAPWFLIRNLVMVLGDVKSPLLKDDLDWVVGHENPQVREEGLVYAAKIIGADSENLMVRGLADPDPQVRRRAVRVLARFPSLGDAAALALAEMVEQRPTREPLAEEEQAVVAAAELLGKIGNRVLPDGRSLEVVLTETLESEAGRGLFSRITGSKSLRTPKMKAAIIEALGKCGSGACKKLISGFMKDKDPAIKQAAQMAVTRLGNG